MTMHRVDLGLACFFVFILKHWCNIHHKHTLIFHLYQTPNISSQKKEQHRYVNHSHRQTSPSAVLCIKCFNISNKVFYEGFSSTFLPEGNWTEVPTLLYVSDLGLAKGHTETVLCEISGEC